LAWGVERLNALGGDILEFESEEKKGTPQ